MIVFHGKVLTYPIGNEAEKARVCAACREMGVPDEQMHWEKREQKSLFFDCIAAGGKMRYTGHEVSKNEPDDAL